MKPGINSWLEDELYHQYLHDRREIDESWRQLFDTTGETEVATPVAVTPSIVPETAPPPEASIVPAPQALVAGPAEQVVPLRGRGEECGATVATPSAAR
jgi:2-oxoglutarate dehydrogenase complex dehydrogenase (E1) component-like enzyme